MGTSQGVYVYRADATEPNFDNATIKIFPNPVAPDYTGPITIQGLAANSRVKITDLAGNIVNECVVNGGTATWNAANFNNVKAAPGVYFAQCTSIDGFNTSVQKILIQR